MRLLSSCTSMGSHSARCAARTCGSPRLGGRYSRTGTRLLDSPRSMGERARVSLVTGSRSSRWPTSCWPSYPARPSCPPRWSGNSTAAFPEKWMHRSATACSTRSFPGRMPGKCSTPRRASGRHETRSSSNGTPRPPPSGGWSILAPRTTATAPTPSSRMTQPRRS
ncbi:hypothetical protein ACFPRL_00675 [Pseudoclavibacter helvolus]